MGVGEGGDGGRPGAERETGRIPATAREDATQGSPPPRPPPYLTLPAQVAAGVIVAVTYAISFVLRDETLPGVVGGALAGVLTVLVLREIEARRRRRRR